MKKIILTLAFATLLISCKKDTKTKVQEATKAVSADMKVALDSAKVKAAKVFDTAKVKKNAKVIIGKGAEKLEEGAKKLKEAVNK
jgi:hypothetical protein